MAITIAIASTVATAVLAPAAVRGAVADAPVAEAPIHEWLAGAGLASEQFGVIALPLDGGPAIVAHGAQHRLNPGSTIKLLTTYAALALLGRDYRWHTDFILGGPLLDGVLHGDLIVRGGGDPKLVIEDLNQIVAQLRASGLERIDGDLVIDDSIYESATADYGDFDGEPSQPYNVGPFGALMNFKSVRIFIRPAGEIVELSLDPDLAGVALDSRIRLVDGPCRYGAGELQVRDGGVPGMPTVRVSGTYSYACGEQSVFSAVLDHRQFVDALFRAAWQAAGGRWSGRTRIGRGAATGEPWFIWQSPRRLADVVRDIDKFSNNLMARHLMLQLAVEAGSRPATLDAARRELHGWLRSQGLSIPDLVIDNGAGLSRQARTSAAQIASLLRHAAAGPYASVLRESLPIAGIDGTMKSRFVGEPIAGRAWIKTGSLNDVRAIAGYVAAASGRQYAVALIVNGPRASASRPLQDRFLRWVHDNG